ncbi:MAG: LamG domain-containing protein, partial [Synechococcaceae cyanobacterium]|nr:LamG domain-containing protein [Synechococcaceae cyanobacterium]
MNSANTILRGDLTVECWVRAYSWSSPAVTYFPLVSCIAPVSASSGTREKCWKVYFYDTGGGTSLDFAWGNSSGTWTTVYTEENGGLLDDHEWHHLAFVRDVSARTVTYYFDGEMTSYGPSTYSAAGDPFGGEDAALYIGCEPDDSEYMDGDIDEVRIWNRVRTQAEIQSAMSTPIDAADNLENGLRAYYRLDEMLGGAAWEEVTATEEQEMNRTYFAFDSHSASATNQRIIIPDHADLKPTGDFTIEVRCAAPAIATFQYIYYKSNCYALRYSVSAQKFQLGINYSTTGWAWATPTGGNNGLYDLNDDGFVLITVRWHNTGNYFGLTFNGDTDNESTVAVAVGLGSMGANNLILGSDGTSYSKCWISELRIWDDYRTDAEVEEYWNSRLFGTEANLVAWYTFEEAAYLREVKTMVDDNEESASEYDGDTLYDRQGVDSVGTKHDSSNVYHDDSWSTTTGILG